MDIDKREGNSTRVYTVGVKSESDNHHSHDSNSIDGSSEDESEDSFRDRGGGNGEEGGSELRKRGYNES